MRFAIVENNRCTNVVEAKSLELIQSLIPGVDIIPADDSINIGTELGGNALLDGVQLREQAYETLLIREDSMPLLVWEDRPMTVDQANEKWLDYAAEGDTLMMATLQGLIAAAKVYIRELYPDQLTDAQSSVFFNTILQPDIRQKEGTNERTYDNQQGQLLRKALQGDQSHL